MSFCFHAEWLKLSLATKHKINLALTDIRRCQCWMTPHVTWQYAISNEQSIGKQSFRGLPVSMRPAEIAAIFRHKKVLLLLELNIHRSHDTKKRLKKIMVYINGLLNWDDMLWGWFVLMGVVSLFCIQTIFQWNLLFSSLYYFEFFLQHIFKWSFINLTLCAIHGSYFCRHFINFRPACMTKLSFRDLIQHFIQWSVKMPFAQIIIW